MPAQNFENNVQQKMEELKLLPSESVWKNVEGEIRKDKRRRRVLLFLSFLAVVGLGGWLYTVQTTGQQESTIVKKEVQSNPSVIDNSSNQIESGNDREANSNTKEDKKESDHTLSQQNKTEKNKIVNADETKDTDLLSSSIKPAEKDNIETNSKKSTNAFTKSSDRNSVQSNKTALISRSKAFQPGKVERHSVVKRKAAANLGNPDLSGQQTTQIDINTNPERNTQENINGESALISTEEFTIKLNSALPLVAPSSFGFDGTKQVTLPAMNTAALSQYVINPKSIERDKPKIKSVWHFGVSANIGFSNSVDGGLLDVFEKSAVADAASFNQGVGLHGPVNLPSRAQLIAPSSVNPGLSFSVGGFAERKINRRFNINAGLQYSRFSNRTKVGNQVDSTLFLNNSFTTGVYNRFYQNTSSKSYTNNYHFIELPLSLQFRLTKPNRIPLFLSTGVSLGYMFASNALHYDGSYGLYYSDNDLLRKWQLGFSSGLSIRLFSSGKNPIEVGPQIHYKPSNNLKVSGGTSQHLFSAGLGVRWYLK